ncbi:tRNA-dihydrouridine synthase family protein [bacterium]|nr:tRNA-dihydrouridine synthase family protein [bacterium]
MFKLRKKTDQPLLLLAPMMDLSGWAFRELVRRAGGCHLFYSEMLNARRVPIEKDSVPLFRGFENESNLMIQLLGNQADQLTASIRRLEQSFNPLGYDLNMGCSRTAIMRHGWGAAMLQDFNATSKVLAAMRKQTLKPFTVKIRNAWSSIKEAGLFLKMIEEQGIDALIVHPRTPEKIFTRPAKWEWIAEVKAMVSIPVIGNGDILTAADAKRMLEQTQCDGIMIGRGAVANPDIFNLIHEKKPFYSSKAMIFHELIDLMGEEVSHPKRRSELKTFCEYFAEGMPVPHWFWGKIQGLRDSESIIEVATDFLMKNNF